MHITVDDAVYWCSLSGDGEPVVLLHGFTGTSGTWNSVVPDWLPSFRTIAIDLPGHGKQLVIPTIWKRSAMIC